MKYSQEPWDPDHHNPRIYIRGQVLPGDCPPWLRLDPDAVRFEPNTVSAVEALDLVERVVWGNRSDPDRDLLLTRIWIGLMSEPWPEQKDENGDPGFLFPRFHCFGRPFQEMLRRVPGYEGPRNVPDFANDVFEVRPYDWSERDDKPVRPNFLHKPSNLRVFWYKYPFRASEISRVVWPDEWHRIMEECGDSLHR